MDELVWAREPNDAREAHGWLTRALGSPLRALYTPGEVRRMRAERARLARLLKGVPRD